MKETRRTRGIVDWRVLVVGTVIVLGLLSGAVVLAWRGMAHVSPDGARVWALVATALIPVGVFAGYRLGHTEARGRLRGIDDGLDQVVRAASKAIDLRVTNITRTRAAAQPQQNVVVLPPPEPTFTIREQLPAGDVVELE